MRSRLWTLTYPHGAFLGCYANEDIGPRWSRLIVPEPLGKGSGPGVTRRGLRRVVEHKHLDRNIRLLVTRIE